MNGFYVAKGNSRRAVFQVMPWGTIGSDDRIAEASGALSFGEIATDPSGTIYVVEDHDVLYGLAPSTGSGGGGSGGGGGGKGRNK